MKQNEAMGFLRRTLCSNLRGETTPAQVPGEEAYKLLSGTDQGRKALVALMAELAGLQSGELLCETEASATLEREFEAAKPQLANEAIDEEELETLTGQLRHHGVKILSQKKLVAYLVTKVSPRWGATKHLVAQVESWVKRTQNHIPA